MDKALAMRRRKEGEVDFRTVVSQKWEEPRERERAVNLAHSYWEVKSGDHKGTASGHVTMLFKGTYEVSCSTAPSGHKGKEGLGGGCYSVLADPELEQGVISEERQEWRKGSSSMAALPVCPLRLCKPPAEAQG